VVKSSLVLFWARLGSINACEQVGRARFWKRWLEEPTFSADTLGRVHAVLDAKGLRQGLHDVYERLKRNKALPDIYGLGVVVLDGHESHASYLRHCSGCLQRTIHTAGGDRIQFYHRQVTLMLLPGALPGRQAVRTDLKARDWLIVRCEEAGLAVRQDAIGNIFARWNGADPAAPAVGTGSHIDAIPNAGKYDGVVGVLCGLEAIRALQRSGFRPKNSIELLVFATEEPTRFGIGCLGSRLLSGTLAADAAGRLKDNDGESVDEVRRKVGFHGNLQDVKLSRGYYKRFVELHVAAPASLRIAIEGPGGHAGGVLMSDRKDALCAAAELILEVEDAARSSGAVDTAGVCDLFPGAVNSIPGRVGLSLDIRDTDLARRDGVLQTIERASQKIAGKRNVSIRQELLNADAPRRMHP
jgi:Peptidase family M20/M25/M40